MPERVADKDKHRIERVVDALAERFERDVANLVQAHMVHGRPIFMVPLTKEERVARFQDENIRLAQLAGLVQDGDMKAAEKHYAQMVKLVEGENESS